MIHPFGVTGFNLLTALSERNSSPQTASRPFDLNRDGFVLGEGAGMLMLEELEHARKRGAKIYGEIRGYGSTADAFRITDIHPEGRGAISCIKMALRDAEMNPEEIGYVNAHGTSEAITCLLAIRDGVLPPTINYETPDPDCDLDCIPNQARQTRIKAALSNSFGFGGQNVALIISEFKG